MMGFHQCQREGKYRDDEGNLWCKQHHPDTVKARGEAQEKKWKEDQNKREKIWKREAAEKKFCSGVSTEFLQANSLQQLLKEMNDGRNELTGEDKRNGTGKTWKEEGNSGVISETG